MDAWLGRVIDEAEAGQLPVLIAEWLATDDERHWLARALRLDLAVLVERPELVVPCVLRRCGQFGDEAAHFKMRPPPPRDAHVVRALATMWATEWTRRRLRALRPPAVPLDGAVIEEYRTSREGVLHATAAAIGVVGKTGAIAWERASGRRIASPFVPRPAPVWSLERTLAPGRAVLRGPDGIVELELEADEEVWSIDELDASRVLLASKVPDPYDEGDDRYVRLVDRGRVAWRICSTAFDAQLVGDRIYTSDLRSVVARGLGDGVPVATWIVPHHRDCVVIDPNTFVTRTDQVIRVWNTTRSPWPVFEPAPSGHVQWSPDGARMCTGPVVRDARSGAALCTLDLHGVGNWMEGGPPANCRRLLDRTFVEQTPFGLYVWDCTTGRVVVEDRGRCGEILDAVAFDPTGRYHAHWPGRENRDGPNPLRVYELVGGRIVFEGEVTLATAEVRWAYRLGFSRDGEQLWWHDREGVRWVAVLATDAVRRLAVNEPDPAEPAVAIATTVDGMLHVGELAIPCDDNTMHAAPDGRSFAGAYSHFAIAGQ